jgi:hypothetical protein
MRDVLLSVPHLYHLFIVKDPQVDLMLKACYRRSERPMETSILHCNIDFRCVMAF